MHSIQKDIEEFQVQIKNEAIQRAYRALLSYMTGLQSHFTNKYPDFSVSALYFKNSEDIRRLEEGLRNAGLPE